MSRLIFKASDVRDFTVTAATGTGNGTLGLDLTSITGITDTAGNALNATLPMVGEV